jgi:hypothetical protein
MGKLIYFSPWSLLRLSPRALRGRPKDSVEGLITDVRAPMAGIFCRRAQADPRGQPVDFGLRVGHPSGQTRASRFRSRCL